MTEATDMNNLDENQNFQPVGPDETSGESEEISTITIQTHDGRFHTDDVGAVSLLTSYYAKKDTQVNLIRSRDLTLLENADILVDVGGIYDPCTHRYDHHQEDCNEVFQEGFTIPLSSIGMVWKHFGQEILTMYIQHSQSFNYVENYQDHIEKLWVEVYLKAIQEIDAHDNGVLPVKGGKRNYWTHLSVGNLISSHNTRHTNNETLQMKAFEKAVGFFGQVFDTMLNEIIRSYFDFIVGRDVVKKCIDDAPDNREYLIITELVPTIFKCLGKLDPDCQFKFLIFHNEGEDEITIRTRGRKDDIMTPIIPLLCYDAVKEKLGEEREDQLVFVHKNLFIAKTKTIEAATDIVGWSLDNRPQSPDTVPTSYFGLPSFRQNRVGWLVGGGVGLLGIGLGALILSKSNEEGI